MRFKQFILEKQLNTIDEVRNGIARDCRLYLEESGGLPLYRGIDVTHDGPTFNPPVTSRKPRDSSAAFNFMFNAGIDAAFDIENVREKTVFAGSHSQSVQYGIDGFFFPCGQYDYVWSTMIRDSYFSRNYIVKEVAALLQDLTPNSEVSAMSLLELAGEINALFDSLHRRTSADEWIKGDAYLQDRHLIARTMLNKIDGFHESLRQALKQVFGKTYSTVDLKTAISKDVEVLFYKTEGYYHVPINWAQYHSRYKYKESNDELYKWLIGGGDAI